MAELSEATVEIGAVAAEQASAGVSEAAGATGAGSERAVYTALAAGAALEVSVEGLLEEVVGAPEAVSIEAAPVIFVSAISATGSGGWGRVCECDEDGEEVVDVVVMIVGWR